MALGVPARLRPDAVDAGMIRHSVDEYLRNRGRYADELRRID